MFLLSPLELARLALVRADVVAAVVRTAQRFVAEYPDEKLVVVRGWVTLNQQAAEYADSLKEGYRAAPADESFHPLGAAVDLKLVGVDENPAVDKNDPRYRRLVAIGEEEGLRAGMNFKRGLPDPYHFEAREDLAVAKAKWAALTKERRRRFAIVGAVALVIGAAWWVITHKGIR